MPKFVVPNVFKPTVPPPSKSSLFDCGRLHVNCVSESMWHIDALASIFAMPWSSWPNAWSRKCRWMSVDAPILSFEPIWNVVRNCTLRLRSSGLTGLFRSGAYVQ